MFTPKNLTPSVFFASISSESRLKHLIYTTNFFKDYLMNYRHESPYPKSRQQCCPVKTLNQKKITIGYILFPASKHSDTLYVLKQKLIHENLILKQIHTNSLWKTNAKHGIFY